MKECKTNNCKHMRTINDNRAETKRNETKNKKILSNYLVNWIYQKMCKTQLRVERITNSISIHAFTNNDCQTIEQLKRLKFAASATLFCFRFPLFPYKIQYKICTVDNDKRTVSIEKGKRFKLATACSYV